VDDCPFSAVSLQPRTDAVAFSHEAIVIDHLCTGCGICVGACPTATPFRRSSELVPGIDLPDLGIKELRENTLSVTADLSGNARVLVYGCGHGAGLDQLLGPDVAVIKLPCIAMLPPSFIDFVISRGHVDGVFLTGCADGDCHYRLGIKWTNQRLAGERDPYLRKRVPRERIAESWAGITGNKRLQQDLRAFQDRLGSLPPFKRPPHRSADARAGEAAEHHA
jgi:coenzyme F420-reducing hydrogenase delta subunit